MSTQTSRLLRRTLIGLGSAVAMVAGTAALAQGTVTLSGTSSNSCNYSQMTVTPNGNITVSCGSTTNPGIATFVLSHASQTSNYVLAPSTSSSATVARNGGPAEALMVMYSVSGNGCASNSGGIMMLAGQSQTIPFSVGAAGTNCTVTIGAPAGGHIASPNTLTFTAQSSTTPPPPPPPPGVPGDCPAIPTTSIAGDTIISNFQNVQDLRMASGAVAYYPVPAPPSASSVIVEYSQTQGTTAPPNVVTRFQVSRCPGVFDPPGHTIASSCKQTGYFVNINNMKIWTAATSQYPSQAALDAVAPGNCLAPASVGQYYINIQWEYPSCPYGSGNCGFTNRWNQWNSNAP